MILKGCSPAAHSTISKRNITESWSDMDVGDKLFGRSVIAIALKRADGSMRRTGRADHADGVGRVYELQYYYCQSCGDQDTQYQERNAILNCLMLRLESDIKVAKNNLQKAVSTAPLHGYLIGLRYALSLENFLSDLIPRYILGLPKLHETLALAGERAILWCETLYRRLVEICAKIWDVVKPVLCIDSPEGYALPDSEEEELGIGIKDTLSYSWRALKETR